MQMSKKVLDGYWFEIDGGHVALNIKPSSFCKKILGHPKSKRGDIDCLTGHFIFQIWLARNHFVGYLQPLDHWRRIKNITIPSDTLEKVIRTHKKMIILQYSIETNTWFFQYSKNNHSKVVKRQLLCCALFACIWSPYTSLLPMHMPAYHLLSSQPSEDK